MRRLLLLVSVCLFVALSCSKQFERDATDKWESVIESFNEKNDVEGEKVVFLFFTDPHLLSGNNSFSDRIRRNIVTSLSSLKELGALLPIDLCICGGDWLNSGDSQDVAERKLLFADEQMKSIFPYYHKMMGNHDTNYLGTASDGNSTSNLSQEFVNDVYFAETGSSHYSFIYSNTEFFILDSGIDWTPAIDSDKLIQLKWLAQSLLESKCGHIVIGIHIFYNSGSIMPMSEEIVSICESFNDRSSVTIAGKEYDYSDVEGKIHIILSGHDHKDFLERIDRMPVVGTCNYMMEGTPTYDICLLNYSLGVFDLIRVGNGNNRSGKLWM